MTKGTRITQDSMLGWSVLEEIGQIMCALSSAKGRDVSWAGNLVGDSLLAAAFVSYVAPLHHGLQAGAGGAAVDP